MWASAQRDGRPAEYRWRPLFNAAVWLMPTTRVPCSNAAKTQNPSKLPGVPQTNEAIARQSCGMAPRWRFLATFLGPALAASRLQHISDLHSKFALGPRYV